MIVSAAPVALPTPSPAAPVVAIFKVSVPAPAFKVVELEILLLALIVSSPAVDLKRVSSVRRNCVRSSCQLDGNAGRASAAGVEEARFARAVSAEHGRNGCSVLRNTSDECAACSSSICTLVRTNFNRRVDCLGEIVSSSKLVGVNQLVVALSARRGSRLRYS